MKYFIILFSFLFALQASALPTQPMPVIDTNQLPSAASSSLAAYIIRDSIDGSCTNGGLSGHTYVICEASQGAWVARQILGTGSGITAAAVRSALTSVYQVDVDPAEPGSYSAGIQEAINRCPAPGTGGCLVQFRCNTTYNISPTSAWPAPYNPAIDLNSGGQHHDDVTFAGCGMNSIVQYVQSTPSAHTYTKLFSAAGANRLIFKNFRLIWNEQCTSGCGNGNDRAMLYLYEVHNVEITGMSIEATQPMTTDASASPGIAGVEISANDGFSPHHWSTDIRIHHNHFQVGGNAVGWNGCVSCVVDHNTFDWKGYPMNDSTTPTPTTGVAESRGWGTVIDANSFDMSTDGDSQVGRRVYGVQLLINTEGGTVPAGSIRYTGAVVSNNSFYGIKREGDRGIGIIGSNGSVISGNSFNGGVCSGNTNYSCVDDESCSVVGGTCVAGTGSGVLFSIAYINGAAEWSRGNLVQGNTFNNFDDVDDMTDNFYTMWCPLKFQGPSFGADTVNTSDNVFRFNVFKLTDPTDDGFCGNPTWRAVNHQYGNTVVGSDTDCLFGQDALVNLSSGCRFKWTRSTHTFDLQVSGFNLNGKSVASVIGTGATALGTAAIASGACASVVTASAPGVLTTDALSWVPNGDISGITGYAPVTTGALMIYAYPTADNVNFKVCNPTASSITPGAAVTLDWRITR